MALVLNEEQEFLKQTAREFVQEKSPVTEFRRLRDEVDATGFDSALWKEMVELGWAGVVYPEAVGGMDLGYLELGQLFEECGRTLTPHPMLSTVVLAGGCVLAGGNETQQKEILTAVASGERLLALAHQEGPHHNPYAVATRAEKIAGGGYRIEGKKTFVLDGHVADQLVVVARTSGQSGDRAGLTLLVVDSGASGLKITRTIMVDGRNAANIEFESVEVEGTAVLGTVDAGADVLDPVLDRATAVLSAEMLGVLSEAFDRTLEYLKTREQFGVVIGSFQALKHRAAEMFVEIELSRSIVLEALTAIDDGSAEVSATVSCAKARCNDTIYQVGNEAVQMFGGIGVTDEEEIGLFLKRARATQTLLGSSVWHRDRFGQLEGY